MTHRTTSAVAESGAPSYPAIVLSHAGVQKCCSFHGSSCFALPPAHFCRTQEYRNVVLFMAVTVSLPPPAHARVLSQDGRHAFKFRREMKLTLKKI